MNPLIIGIGHKARQGKDLVAERLQKRYGIKHYKPIKAASVRLLRFIQRRRMYHIHIIRFADALKEECRHMYISPSFGFFRADIRISPPGEPPESYLALMIPEEVLSTIKQKHYSIGARREGERLPRKLGSPYYDGQEHKQGRFPELWQFWGSFRREQDEYYWINKVTEQINKIESNKDKPTIVLIPDTRYKNEAEYIKGRGGVVWDIQRIKNGEQLIAGDRDPDHASETDLDDWEFDAVLSAPDGDKATLLKRADRVFEETIKNAGI